MAANSTANSVPPDRDDLGGQPLEVDEEGEESDEYDLEGDDGDGDSEEDDDDGDGDYDDEEEEGVEPNEGGLTAMLLGGSSHVAEGIQDEDEEEYDEEGDKTSSLPVAPSTKKRTLDEVQEGEGPVNGEAKKTKV